MRSFDILVLAATLAGATCAAANDDARQISPEVLSDLNTWLDANVEYDRPDSNPQIKIVSPERILTLHGVPDRAGGPTLGLYDEITETIYLAEPWSADTLYDVSVLLHEMVHHRQAQQHWYCPQAQEWRAYQIQAQWLVEQDIEDEFYWPAILLQSSCAKRDIHPES